MQEQQTKVSSAGFQLEKKNGEAIQSKYVILTKYRYQL